MTEQKARIKAQEEAKEAVRKNNYKGAILSSVGFGKGKVMLDLAQELVDAGKVKSILYVCDNTRLRDDNESGFPEQIEQWSPKLKDIIDLECYQTTYKWINKKYDLILGDEIDFALTPQYSKVFFNNKFKYVIVVTGTLASTKKKLLDEIAPIVYKCRTVDAEELGIINKSVYYIYNYRMSESESKQYLKWSGALFKAIQAEKPQETIHYLGNRRKDFLSTLESSQKHCKKIMNWLWKKSKKTRLIIFCERTSQADKVCKWSFHGGNQKDNNLQKFQDEEISGIAVVAKVKRGLNVRNANTAIYESLCSSSTEFDQRNGRLKRLPVSQLATIIFMCPWYQKIDGDGEITWKPTVVDTWIGKATVNLNSDLIQLKL